ncbi:antibiotic ABC transporter permease [Halovenus rubra]|uniref:Antibiotic ABC transporter permease n=2 Tax=Halovenus rubra TaxID=869890 RepID=A0ABD5X921_9EURY|nr:antibiotic ABC transporter permease [Halovenus rubra]
MTESVLDNSSHDYLQVLLDSLSYARDRNYIGYDKHDGMSSKIRRSLPADNRWLNLCFQESVKRAPVNLRPLSLVEPRPNPKGLSLFLMANYSAHQLTGEQTYRSEANALAERIIEHGSDTYSGFAIGHSHELQGLHGKTPAGVPGIVQTSYGVKALLRLSNKNEQYQEIAASGSDFLENDLDPVQANPGIKVKYNPTDSGESYTLNANAVAARMLVDLYACIGDERYKSMATDILEYVASHQQPIGGWKYTDPPSASHLSMDNYHNGFIIESFLRYQELIDSNAFADVVDQAIEFYRTELYDDNGAPHWDEQKPYPRDVHAAAQGILVFTYSGNREFAREIVDWTLDNLYAGQGQFYYQKQKWFTKRFTLMRWCQAWMTYALSEFLRQRDEELSTEG